jgi:ATP-dependent DNA helicase RecG
VRIEGGSWTLGFRATRAIVKALREAERLSTGELAELIDVARPTILRYLHSLRDAGLVEWVGKSERDPRAYWRLS